MAAVQAGEPRAFDALWAATSGRVMGYLWSLKRNRATAEDLLQVTFLKVHRARDTYATGAPVMPWLLAIARRSAVDHWRATARNPATPSLDDTLPDLVGPPSPALEALEAEPGLAELLRTELRQMPAPQSEALMLLKVQGLSLVEAAALTGISVGAMKLRAHRAYEHLRRVLGARGARP
jgi:RNA polymerase sigma-70 factor (ECF subfamily)